jgi:cytochrome b6-f complex iron-sulfur subunit
VLQGGLVGTLALAIPACGPNTSPPSGPVAAGNVANLSVGTLEVVAGEDVVLGRDAGGLYAMSAVCTHAGCLVSAQGPATAGLYCGCHGSRFDSSGAVTRGPAGTPLQHYQVDVATDGTITVRGDIPVAADARTPVG